MEVADLVRAAASAERMRYLLHRYGSTAYRAMMTVHRSDAARNDGRARWIRDILDELDR